MKLEKVKTNHGIHIRGPYKGGTAYIATFIDRPEYEEIVDRVIAMENGETTVVLTENLIKILPHTCGDCRLTQTCEVPILTQNEVGDFTGRTVTTDRDACRAHHIAYLTGSDQ